MMTSHYFLAAIVAVSIFLACQQLKTQPDETLDAFILRKTDSLYKKGKVPGVFVGVLNNSERNYYNFGFADPDKKMPFDSATVFEIGSITKTFTAYVLESVLKEKGIGDSTSIITYLPDSLQKNKALEATTFVSLLNHTSGLPRLPENMDLETNMMQPYADYNLQMLFDYLETATPKPDGRSYYSNLGATLAGILSERISGKPYRILLDEYILTPFKMTMARQPLSEITNKAQGHFSGNKSDYWDMNVMMPAGGIVCSTSDLLTYLQHISQPSNDSKAIVDDLLTPTVAVSRTLRVAKGWHIIEEKDKPAVYWHNGGTYGFSTYAAFLKDKSKAVVIVVNEFNKNQVSDVLGELIIKKLME
jgi:CubicO group peptidase (beta-lactamase class C family)